MSRTRPTPFVVFGDAPGASTGLSRILTDLTVRLRTADLGLDVRTVGWTPWRSLPLHGIESHAEIAGCQWPAWVYSDFASRGREALTAAWRTWFGDRSGIVLAIWDPARLEGLAQVDLPVHRWGYLPVDAHNIVGRITGPAAAWLESLDRVAAYTAFGATWLDRGEGAPPTAIPHGLNRGWYAGPTPNAAGWADRIFPEGRAVVGCVATNTRRKDLGLFAATLHALGDEYWGWLHTNALVSEAWSIPQLLTDFGLASRVIITGIDGPLDDDRLIAAYDRCAVTVAPGRGEGFGYPIAESLACGRPAFHMNHGGGAEVAYPADLIEPIGGLLEGPYALYRPILQPTTVAKAIRQVIPHPHQVAPAAEIQARCRDWAQQFRWDRIWPHWVTWITEGLTTRETTHPSAPLSTIVPFPHDAQGVSDV